LSAQFMYKILSLKLIYPEAQISVALFAGSTFITLSSYREFRRVWEDKFAFLDGMLFSARHFSDVGKGINWGVTFTVWGDGKMFPQELSKKVALRIKDINLETREVEDIGSKKIHAAEDRTYSEWIRKEVRGIRTIDVLPLVGAIRVKTLCWGKKIPGALGYIVDASYDNISGNALCFLLSSAFFGKGFSVIPENLKKVAAVFAARRCVQSNWQNSQDEYFVPNEQHPEYEHWADDAIVYSLFNNGSGQSSLRNINFQGKFWNIENHFFFMSNVEMKQLAKSYLFNEMERDAMSFGEDRYVYKLLKDIQLSADAKQVLEAARFLVIKSMEVRKEYHEKHPERHLQAWDAGWAQLKPMLKEYFKQEYNKFRELYKQFENRMREGVYKFGFLRR